MNIELDEVVAQDASDDALELAAVGAHGGGLRMIWRVIGSPTSQDATGPFPPP